MNPRFHSKIPSGFLSGRILVIAILVVLSSGSFILGYFVGRSSRTVEEPAKVTPLYQPPEPGRAGDEEIGKTEEPLPDLFEEKVGEGESSPATEKKVDRIMEKLPSDHEEEKPPSPTPPAVKTKKTVSVHPEKNKKTEHTVTTKKTGDYYTIQVGAFSSHSQARKLEKRLSSKGYHVEVIRSSGEKTIYRVRVGKYRDRKAAEVAAIRLTRAEGLKTFVIRQKG